MALDELSVARQTVIAAFSIIVWRVYAGSAFGFGDQDLARQFLERSFGPKHKEDRTDDLQPL